MGSICACGSLLAAALLAGGCTSLSSGGESAASTECAGDRTRPITQDVLIATLRQNGFTVHPDPTDVVCTSSDPVVRSDPDEDMPISVTNILFEGPHENIDLHDRIGKREGHVSCGLRRGPIWGALEKDLDAPAASPIFSGEKATFSVANVECTIYPDGPKSGEQVRNLDRAVTKLARLAAG
jgi:hypothetical protein